MGRPNEAARLAEFPEARHDILNETVHRDVAAITDFVLAAGEASPARGVKPGPFGQRP
jgi:hypothetical protein